MEHPRAQMSNISADIDQLNKCNLCPFTSRMKCTFHRHLMKEHGIKLKGLEANLSSENSKLCPVTTDYGLDQKFIPENISEFECDICKRKFKLTISHYQLHVKSCKKKSKFIEESGIQYFCPRCGVGGFINPKKIKKHLLVCGLTRDICCQICPFKSVSMQRIQGHFIDKHNLICKPVDEPDFEQALNGTPYTLERPIEVEVLPQNKLVTDYSVLKNRKEIK